MTEPLTVVIPSRGRPGNLVRLCEAWEATAIGGAGLLVLLDNDDDTADESLLLVDRYPFIEIEVGPRDGFAPRLNTAAVALADSGAFAVGSWTDKHLPRTVGWDARIVESLVGLGSGFVYCDDAAHHENLMTASHVTCSVVSTLGYLTPPGMLHLYIDNVWTELARAIDRRVYLPDVLIEHMHPAHGKGEWDELMRAANSDESYDRDEAAFLAYREHQFAADVERLAAL